MRANVLILLAALAGFVMPLQVHAQSAVKLAPPSGHPNLTVAVSGASFANSEAVDVYVDTVDTMLLVSSATGTISGSVTIPATAQPGKHYVTAIGRHSGDAAQIAFSVTTPWNEQGFGAAHLGWNPYENTITTGNVGSLGPLWQISVNGYGDAPIVSGGRVFLGTGGGVKAVSSVTGSTLWTALPSSIFYASPALVGSSLYIGEGGTGTMYALNATTGATIWSQTTGGTFQSSPVVSGGIVYAGCVDDKVYAFSAATGKIIWTYTTNGFIDSSPAIVNGVVYIGSGDDYVYALNAATGTLIWSYKTGNAVESPPAVRNGVVYVGSDDSKMYAINAAGPNAGSLLWSYTAGGAVFAAPAIAGNLVYFGSTDGNLYAANLHTGALSWSVATGGIVESPVVANGVVYVSSRSNTFFEIAASYGGILATQVTGYSFLGNPTVSDGVVYLNTFSDGTYAFSLLSGTDAVRVHAPRPSSLRPDMRLAVSR